MNIRDRKSANGQRELHYYDTVGVVFQAEEVEEQKGVWKRYYGFVSAHRIARVPAEEIEFPLFPERLKRNGEDPNGGKLTHGFGCIMPTPGRSNAKAGYITFTKLGVGHPLPFHVIIRNCRGVAQTLPGALLQPPGDARSLPPGVRLVLEFSPMTGRPQHPSGIADWQAVPLRQEARVVGARPTGKALAPQEETPVISGDLGDFFDISRPGHYRLQAFINAGADGPAGEAEAVTFDLYP
ncbi:MAG: hypothetical protein ACAI35_28285 [Candidatus Methylacidiphilales bacterium]|nr:hypothetical protein [Candidatus Methylacidiphilales bacterium]